MRIPQHVISGALTLLLASGACRSGEPEAPAPARTGPEDPAGSRDANAASEAAAAPEPPPDPERADKLRDLDELCKAVDHDYADGTLGDYYGGLKPRTRWGAAQLEAGNESIKPGRLLERAVAELDPGARDPTLEHCRVLLDYLDDVE